MGYYSRQSLQYLENDDTYIVDSRLLWLEDLNYRLQELLEQGANYSSAVQLSQEDLKYSVAESLMCVKDVQRAIEISKELISETMHDDGFIKEETEEWFSLAHTPNESVDLRETKAKRIA